MRKLTDFKLEQIPLWQVVAVTTSADDYSMDRTILVENYPESSEFTVVLGEHCSCYEFDNTYWEAFVYTQEELAMLVRPWSSEDVSSSQLLMVPHLKLRTEYSYSHIWQEEAPS